jgi:hypothetical protein
MLENYKKSELGVISQIDRKPYNYDVEYSDSRYSYFNDRGNILNLRLGHIIGSIGKIPDSLMDVGYGNGDFLNRCKSTIKTLYGNDVPPVYPLSEDIKFVENLVDQEVEVITFFDSLEHFHNIEFVKDLRCKYIIISLPWCYNGEDDNWFTQWKHRKPDEHIHHFNEKSLENFMRSQNFKMINYCNLEDSIRVDKNLSPNILTSAFVKID